MVAISYHLYPDPLPPFSNKNESQIPKKIEKAEKPPLELKAEQNFTKAGEQLDQVAKYFVTILEQMGYVEPQIFFTAIPPTKKNMTLYASDDPGTADFVYGYESSPTTRLTYRDCNHRIAVLSQYLNDQNV